MHIHALHSQHCKKRFALARVAVRLRGRSRAAAGLRRTPGVVCAPPPSSRLMSGRRIGVRLRPSSGVRSWEPLRTGLMCGKNLWKHACGDEKLRTRGRSRSMQSIFLLMLSYLVSCLSANADQILRQDYAKILQLDASHWCGTRSKRDFPRCPRRTAPLGSCAHADPCGAGDATPGGLV